MHEPLPDRRESEQKYRDLFDLSPDAIYITSSNGYFISANPAGLELLRCTAEELPKISIAATYLACDRAQFLERADQMRSQSLLRFERAFVRADGTTVPVEVSVSPISHERFQSIVRDISDRKQAEAVVKNHERELQTLIETIPHQIAVIGPKGKYLYANRQLLEYLNLSLEEFLAEGFPSKIVHPDDLDQLLADRQRGYASEAHFEMEARILRRDGQYRWLLYHVNPLRDDHGRILRWYLTATEIEDQKQAEERIRKENISLREQIDKALMFEEIVGSTPALQAVLSAVSQVAPTDSTVLILGETGTGKELIARAIHKRSRRSSQGFITMNCAAIPPSLIASELFGHEKGAFTGALQQRLGRFELADGGTIFLDEIGELPIDAQVALLHVLQEREFERVGGTRSIKSDVRVIAATNRDLQTAIAAGNFRSDLFYRLNVFPIEIPPLRQRREDIPLLVEYFIARYARKIGRQIFRIDSRSLDLLLSYSWPGNIRELQNVIERGVTVCKTGTLSFDESWISAKPVYVKRERQSLSRMPANQEREMIEAALAETRGRVSGHSGAAAKLGIPPSTLESKIKSLKIEKQHFIPRYHESPRQLSSPLSLESRKY